MQQNHSETRIMQLEKIDLQRLTGILNFLFLNTAKACGINVHCLFSCALQFHGYCFLIGKKIYR